MNRPELRIVFFKSSFLQYEPHEYKLELVNCEKLSKEDKQLFISKSIEKLLNELNKQ